MKEIEEKLEEFTQQLGDFSQLVKEFKDKKEPAALPFLKAVDVPYKELFLNNGRVLFNGVGEYKVVMYINGIRELPLGNKHYLCKDPYGHCNYMVLSFPLTKHNSRYLSSGISLRSLECATVSIANDPDHTYYLDAILENDDACLVRSIDDRASTKLEGLFYPQSGVAWK